MGASLLSLLLASAGCLLLALLPLLRGAATPVPRALRLQVTARRDAGEDLFVLRLRRIWWLRWWPLPRYRGGQSLALSLPGERLRRRYSLARWRRLPFAYELAIRREHAGRFSPRLHRLAQCGSWLQVVPPSGEFLLPEACDRRRVLIAGGIGITPLLAMLDEWAGRFADGVETHLFWQVRHPHELIYREALQALQQRRPQLRLHLLQSRPSAGDAQRIDITLLQQRLLRLDDCEFCLCAGPALLDSLLQQLRSAGVAPERLHYERFGLAAGGATGAFMIELDGRRLPYDGHPTLLDAIEDAQIDWPADCRIGSCGLCRLRVDSGQLTHLLDAESPTGADEVLACCVRPASDLRLRRSAILQGVA